MIKLIHKPTFIFLFTIVVFQFNCHQPKKVNVNQARLDYIKTIIPESLQYKMLRYDSIFNANPNLKFPPMGEGFEKNIADSLKYLLPILDTVFEDDQRYREANEPALMNKHIKEVRYLDSLNLAKVLPIIDQHGIFSIKEIGFKSHAALFLVLQHAPKNIQLKYLPVIEKAYKNKKINSTDYAMYFDRASKHTYNMQTYGTQVMLNSKIKGEGELYPVIDIDNLNKRRDSMNLGSIEKYMAQFGLPWDINKYKNDLPALKIKYKIIE